MSPPSSGPPGAGDGLGGVGADVGAALLLGHPHARDRAALVGQRAAGRSRRSARRAAGTQRCAEGRVGRERRRRGIRHGDRAEVTLLVLGPRDEAGGAAHVGAVPVGLGPRLGGEAGADGDLHEGVPRGVELDLVEPLTGGGVGAQHGLVAVRLHGPARVPASSPARAPSARHLLVCRRRRPATQPLAQRWLAVDRVVVGERGHLVGDGVGGHDAHYAGIPWRGESQGSGASRARARARSPARRTDSRSRPSGSACGTA